MRKREFVDVYMKISGLNFRKDAEQQVEWFLEAMKQSLIKEDLLTFRGLGSFVKSESNFKSAFNFKTKERIEIPVKKNIKFKIGKEFDERINKIKKRKKD